MLTDIIAQYLTAHKRLVVPQLGAFIVKEPDHTVLFSELLRRDDGVLRQVLRDAGMAELEAAGEIDRFVFEVRHAVEHGGTYRMRGFGQMAPGPNGTIAFRYDPQLDVAPPPRRPRRSLLSRLRRTVPVRTPTTETAERRAENPGTMPPCGRTRWPKP